MRVPPDLSFGVSRRCWASQLPLLGWQILARDQLPICRETKPSCHENFLPAVGGWAAKNSSKNSCIVAREFLLFCYIQNSENSGPAVPDRSAET
jgi:hypothetical protein